MFVRMHVGMSTQIAVSIRLVECVYRCVCSRYVSPIIQHHMFSIHSGLLGLLGYSCICNLVTLTHSKTHGKRAYDLVYGTVDGC